MLLDQRGTGLSSIVTCGSIAAIGSPGNPSSFSSVLLIYLLEDQANYLSLFRADSIVADCEILRKQLLGEKGNSSVPSITFTGTWSLLGQSYGGFCVAHYLSVAPQGLKEVMFVGWWQQKNNNNVIQEDYLAWNGCTLTKCIR